MKNKAFLSAVFSVALGCVLGFLIGGKNGVIAGTVFACGCAYLAGVQWRDVIAETFTAVSNAVDTSYHESIRRRRIKAERRDNCMEAAKRSNIAAKMYYGERLERAFRIIPVCTVSIATLSWMVLAWLDIFRSDVPMALVGITIAFFVALSAFVGHGIGISMLMCAGMGRRSATKRKYVSYADDWQYEKMKSSVENYISACHTHSQYLAVGAFRSFVRDGSVTIHDNPIWAMLLKTLWQLVIRLVVSSANFLLFIPVFSYMLLRMGFLYANHRTRIVGAIATIVTLLTLSVNYYFNLLVFNSQGFWISMGTAPLLAGLLAKKLVCTVGENERPMELDLPEGKFLEYPTFRF